MARKRFRVREALVVAAILLAFGLLVGLPRHRSFQTTPEMQAFIHQVIPAGTNTQLARQKMVEQGFEPCEISQSQTNGKPCISFARLDGPPLNPVRTQWTVALTVNDDKVESVLVWKSLTGP